jgi:catalase
VLAYTFELGKCYEQAVKERQLLALANIDAELCAKVAQGLGLPAPERTVEYAEPDASPALSQVGEEWPADGRMVGIVVDPDGDTGGADDVRRAVLAAGMVPLVIGPHGGDLGGGLIAQRTFGTARSVEFDAVLVAGAAPPAPDAAVARDTKAGTPSGATDPRVTLLVQECFRHSKAVGAWGDGRGVLEASACAGAGVVVGADPAEVFAEVQELMSTHRVWERFATTV